MAKDRGREMKVTAVYRNTEVEPRRSSQSFVTSSDKKQQVSEKKHIRNDTRPLSHYSPAFNWVIMSPENEGLAHCKFILLFAIAMDLLGISIVLIGVFAPLEVTGRDFGDLLVFSGVLLVLLSMAGWVMWYSGNIEGLTSWKDLGDTSGAVDRLARSLSRRIRKSHRGHTAP